MRATITLELAGHWEPGQRGGGVWLYLPQRMLRVWASLGPSGSHRGLWRTQLPADGLDGWNWRAGPWRHSLTVLAHTRKLESRGR